MLAPYIKFPLYSYGGEILCAEGYTRINRLQAQAGVHKGCFPRNLIWLLSAIEFITTT